ncbi:hypothetical protein Tco_0195372 [Tanacetum coccineum]
MPYWEVADTEVQSPLPNTYKPESSPVQDTDASTSDSSPDLKKITKTQWKQHEEAVVSYADLKASIEGYYEENIDHRDQTDKVIDAAMNSLDKNSIARGELPNVINGVTEALKAIQDAVKEDHSLVESLQATALTQEEHLASWAKSSTSMALNLGPRMTAIDSSQAKIRSEISSLRKDTSDIKSIMTEIYHSFKGQSSAPLSSVPQKTLAITKGLANVRGRMSHRLTLKNIPLTLRGKGKAILTDDQPANQRKLVPALKEVHPNPDAPILVPYEINGKIFHLTDEQIQAHLDKEEKIKKAAEKAKLFEITKTGVIKVVQEEAKDIGLDPKKIISAKAGEKFKKAQDAEH